MRMNKTSMSVFVFSNGFQVKQFTANYKDAQDYSLICIVFLKDNN